MASCLVSVVNSIVAVTEYAVLCATDVFGTERSLVTMGLHQQSSTPAIVFDMAQLATGSPNNVYGLLMLIKMMIESIHRLQLCILPLIDRPTIELPLKPLSLICTFPYSLFHIDYQLAIWLMLFHSIIWKGSSSKKCRQHRHHYHNKRTVLSKLSHHLLLNHSNPIKNLSKVIVVVFSNNLCPMHVLAPRQLKSSTH